MKKTILCILAAIGLVGCAETPTVSVRRIEVEGDQAHYVGKRLVADLEMASVKITESAESAPVLKATSTIKKLEGGVRVFTLEITDGKGLNIKETMSTQDVTPFAGEQFIVQAVDKAADSLARQLRPPNKEIPPTPASQEKKHYSTS